MRRKFLTNLLLLVFLNFLIKPFWVFGIDRGVQNMVGPSEYGFYFTILNFAFIFQIFLDFGITNYNNKNIAQNNHLLSKHFSSIIIIRFLFAALYMLIIMGVGMLMKYDARQMQLLLIIGINQFLLSLILYLRSNISALLLFRIDSFLSVLDRILMIIICSVLLWGNVTEQEFQISWFVYAQTVAYFTTALIALTFLLPKMNFKGLNWNPAFFVIIIKQSLPYATLILLMGMYSRIDTVLIERLLPQNGELQAGIYASAFRLLDVANNMSGYLFAVLLLPIFAKMIKEKEDLSQMVKLSFTLLFLFSTAVAISSYFYGEDIMRLLYSQHNTEILMQYNERMIETANVFRILMTVFVATSSTYIFGTLLTANGSLKVLNIVALLGMIVSLVINFVLIPQFEAYGSAWASFSAQWITALLQIYFAIKLLSINIERKYILNLLIYILVVIALSYFSILLPFNWIINFALLSISVVALAFALGLLNVKAFISIIQNEK